MSNNNYNSVSDTTSVGPLTVQLKPPGGTVPCRQCSNTATVRIVQTGEPLCDSCTPKGAVLSKIPPGGESEFRVSIRTPDGVPVDISDRFGNIEWRYAIDDGPWTVLGQSALPGLREGDIVKLPAQSLGRYTAYMIGVCISGCRGNGFLGFEEDEIVNDDEGDNEFTYGGEA